MEAVPAWLSYATAIGSIATPILVGILGLLGWRMRTSIERRMELEDKSIERRMELEDKSIERRMEIEDKSIMRRMELEDKLREDRIQIYNDILEPYIILLMSDAAWQMDSKNKNKDKQVVAMQLLLSLDYHRKAFKLSLVGSDSVIIAYNNLMQYSFQMGDRKAQQNPSNSLSSESREMVSLIGKLFLEIRKSMGNEATKLDQWQMLEWFIKDARNLRHAAPEPS